MGLDYFPVQLEVQPISNSPEQLARKAESPACPRFAHVQTPPASFSLDSGHPRASVFTKNARITPKWPFSVI